MKWFLGILASLIVAGVGWVSAQLYTVISDNPGTQTTLVELTEQVTALTQANNDLILALEKSKLENIQAFISMSQAMRPRLMGPENEPTYTEVSYSVAPPVEMLAPVSVISEPTESAGPEPISISVFNPELPPPNAAAIPLLTEAEIVESKELTEAEESLKALMAREVEQRTHVEHLESTRKK